MPYTNVRRFLLAALTTSLLAAQTGCSGIFDVRDRRPNEARITISGTSPVPLQLTLSTNFTASFNSQTGLWDVNFVTAEELEVTLPMEHTIRLDTDRFLVRLRNPSSDATADVHMQVFFDGRQWYNQQATLVDAHLQFIHTF
jgi:hypothetical protein